MNEQELQKFIVRGIQKYKKEEKPTLSSHVVLAVNKTMAVLEFSATQSDLCPMGCMSRDDIEEWLSKGPEDQEFCVFIGREKGSPESPTGENLQMVMVKIADHKLALDQAQYEFPDLDFIGIQTSILLRHELNLLIGHN